MARTMMVPFVALLLYGASPALAQSFLGSAENFAVLAGGAVTCTDSVVIGDVGAGTVATQTRCTILGTVHQADPAAAQAYADFLSAYATLASTPCPSSGPTLDPSVSQTLGPGVYCVAAAATFTGVTLTLNGPANGIWVFKVGTGGTGALTGTNFSVVMAGGGQACNVHWWVHDAATLTTSNFKGTILAGAAITVTGGTLNGDALAGGGGSTSAPTGAVTLSNATVTGCKATAGGGLSICEQDDKSDKGHKDDKDHQNDKDNKNDNDHKNDKDQKNNKDQKNDQDQKGQKKGR